MSISQKSTKEDAVSLASRWLTNEAIGDNYIRLETVKAVPNLKFSHILVGQDIFNWIHQTLKNQ